MKVGVVGGREFNNYELVCQELNPLVNDIDVIVSGGARGADTLGAKWASENGKNCLVFYPEWDKYGKSAGFRRNQDIVKNSDMVIAFWDGLSKGTKSSIDLCNKFGIKVKIINY